jgi:hypothetical protein
MRDELRGASCEGEGLPANGSSGQGEDIGADWEKFVRREGIVCRNPAGRERPRQAESRGGASSAAGWWHGM